MKYAHVRGACVLLVSAAALSLGACGGGSTPQGDASALPGSNAAAPQLAMRASGGASTGTPTPEVGPYQVGGTLTGLGPGQVVVLEYNAGQGASGVAELAANGAFLLPGGLATGSPYLVTVRSHTTGVGCQVGNASGTVGAADVTDVVVTCGPGAPSVLASIAGARSKPEPGFTGGLAMDNSGNFYAYGWDASKVGVDGGSPVMALFKVNPSGATQILHRYGTASRPDGWNPSGRLAIDANGNIYGTIEQGGVHQAGMLYEIDMSGKDPKYKILYAFGANPGDGAHPAGGVILGGNGTSLYGTTREGGANDTGTVFEFDMSSTNPTETVLYSFRPDAQPIAKGSDTSDAVHPDGGVTLDGNGNLWGATASGGQYCDVSVVDGRQQSIGPSGAVYAINPVKKSEIFLTPFDCMGGQGRQEVGDLSFDDVTHSVYGVATSSNLGNDGLGTVFSVDTRSPAQIQVLHVFSGGPGDGSRPMSSVVVSDGVVYGTTSAGGANDNGTLFAVALPTQQTSTASEAVLASFGSSARNPYGHLISDGAGNLYGLAAHGGRDGGGVLFKFD